MAYVAHYDKPEEEQGYYKKIVDLLNHYEDGWNLFINAHRENNYDYPLRPKPEFENNPYIPQTWIELTDAVCQIIAQDKYELEVYPNLIEIIRSDQMLDAYTTTGLPFSYRHWSFGKRRMQEEQKYDASKHMAYEIVINSNPCLSYCMDSNVPLVQMIVIAHAAYGHNSVFKNNYLFEENTDADNILVDNKRMRDFVAECEQLYGEAEVSALLNFCHAMRFVDTSENVKRKTMSPGEAAKRRQDQILQSHLNAPHTSVFNSVVNDNKKAPPPEYHHPREGEKNILMFMAENSPHMPMWKRSIMKMSSRLAQYFKPQMMTQTLNEGMATFVHDKVITTMRDIGLIDAGMYMEYERTNWGVIQQQPGVVLVRDEDGNIQEKLAGARFNPYRLGLSILRDIERICKNPTEEDKEWFPHFAGEPDWMSVVKHAVYSSSDETFIHRFLSPQVMRELDMLAVESDPAKNYYEITAIHAGEGFAKMREVLAKDYRFHEKIPNITLHDYQDRTDRCLILRHHIINDQHLNMDDAAMILEYMHHQWEHPIVLESVDDNGEVVDRISSPPDYDYTKFTPVRAGMGGPQP